jgi:hypothetical protein
MSKQATIFLFVCFSAFLAVSFNGMKKTILLTFISVSVLYLFFQFPRNNEWFTKRILTYWKDFKHQKNQLSLEQRKIKRWEHSYTFSKRITHFIAQQQDMTKALVLLPPTSYFKEKEVSYSVPEPAVFYYYTGLKTVWVHSPEAIKVNWMVVANNGDLKIVPVTDRKALSDSLAKFQKYP